MAQNEASLRPLVHSPTEQELTDLIYKIRWVDGIKKDSSMVSDKEMAKVILEFLEDKERNGGR